MQNNTRILENSIKIMPKSRHKKQGKRRKLRVIPCLILALCICALILLGALIPSNASANETAATGVSKDNFITVIVKPGDTIWDLVRAANPDYTGNLQKLVYELKNINNLTGSTISPGQILYIPQNT